MPGQLKCPQHHIMLKCARDLWYCDKCDYFTGGMQHLKGACDEARAMVLKGGGIDAIRARAKVIAKRVRDNAKELKLTRKEIHDEHGYYDPITHFRTANGDFRCKDCGGGHEPDRPHDGVTQAKRDGGSKEQARKLA